MALRYVHLTTSGQTQRIGGNNAWSTLWTVNVNTAAAAAALTIYDGDSSGSVIAVVDATSAKSLCYGVVAKNGLYLSLAGGNADVTVGYE